MGFEHTERLETGVSAEAIWRLWADPATWAQWDPPVQTVSLTAPLAEGATGTMSLAGIEVPVLVEVVEPGRRFVDVLTMGELRIRIDHVVTSRGTGCAIEVHTTIEGPGAADIGPMVTTDAPVALAQLVATAQ